MLKHILASLTLLSATSVAAEGIYTSGLLNCGLWVENRSRGTAAVFEGYALGMMNGLALGSGTEFWNANGNMLKPEQVYLYIDKFCRENPLNDVITGAVTLIDEHTGGAYKRSHN